MPTVIMNQDSETVKVDWRSQLCAIAVDIKLSHTLFALPFAVLATFMSAETEANSAFPGENQSAVFPGIDQLGLIILCMFFARTAAMTFNRWADRQIDAENDRTTQRAIPAGRVNSRFMLLLTIITSALFFLSSAGFWWLKQNQWPILLSPLVLIWLLGYSYTKRFTWLCHLYLGVALALSPVCSALAIFPDYLQSIDVWLLSAMVIGWVAGFDVIYAIQDYQADQKLGLYSMPSRLGVHASLWISRFFHLVAIALLWCLAVKADVLGLWFMVAACIATGLIVLEQVIVWRSKIKHLDLVFFTLNGMVSLVLGLAGIIDILT